MQSNQNISNEENLSQQLQHMSPFMINAEQETSQALNDTILRKILRHQFQTIPDYLSLKKSALNKEFNSILPSTLSLQDIRDVAILMHKIVSIGFIQSLWLTYHKSMMGTLDCSLSMNPLDRHVCPIKVQSFMRQCKIGNHHDKEVIFDFIHRCRTQLNHQDEQYRRELNRKTCSLIGYTPYINSTIEKFVEHELQDVHIKIKQKQTLQQYDYVKEILRRAYLTLNPNQSQIKIYKHLCKLMQRKAITKHEVDLLKKKAVLDHTLNLFERDFSTSTSLLTSINNSPSDKDFYNQLKDVTKQAREELMNLSMEYTDVQKKNYEQLYTKTLNDIRMKQQKLPIKERLTSQMWKLIEQSQANICERVECSYKFQFQLFHLQSIKR